MSKDKSKYETDAIVNHKILDLQRREADLTEKLREALNKVIEFKYNRMNNYKYFSKITKVKKK